MSKYMKLFDTHSDYEDFVGGGGILKPNVSHCVQENEVHYKPIPNFNGHEYVDLGLPSGTLWATMNVGSESETDNGLYFAWGETEGYDIDQISGSATPHRDFDWQSYKLSDNATSASSPNFIKYNTKSNYGVVDNIMRLELVDDAAHAYMGGDWKMPTSEQFDELFSLDYIEFNPAAENYQGSGMICSTFTNVNNGNVLVLPWAGSFNYGGNFYDAAYYWTSSLSEQSNTNYDCRNSYRFICNGDRWGASGVDYRIYGMTIRGVVSDT